MTKKLLILITILLILIIAIITMGIFAFLNKNKPKIVEIRTFSEIPGFSFEYPVFKGWQPGEPQITKDDKTGDITAVMYLSNPTNTLFEIGTRISIVKSSRSEKIKAGSLKGNPQGIAYLYTNENKYGPVSITFYPSDFIVDIYPFEYEGDGYSGKVFVDEVVKSFKFDDLSGLKDVLTKICSAELANDNKNAEIEVFIDDKERTKILKLKSNIPDAAEKYFDINGLEILSFPTGPTVEGDKIYDEIVKKEANIMKGLKLQKKIDCSFYKT